MLPSSTFDSYTGQADMEIDDNQVNDDDYVYNQVDVFKIRRFKWPIPISIVSVSSDSRAVCFPQNRIPKNMYRFHPNVLNSVNVVEEVTANIWSTQATNTCLPIIVQTSPIVTLFASAPHDNQSTNTTLPALTTWMDSTCHLLKFHRMCIEKLVPFPSSLTPAQYEAAASEFIEQGKLFDAEHWEILSELMNGSQQDKNTMVKICKQLEAAAFDLLHRIERFLFQILIKPHAESKLTLAHMLTPRISYSLDQFQKPARARALALKYFDTKLSVEYRYFEKNCNDFKPEYPTTEQHPLHSSSIGSFVCVDPKTNAIQYNNCTRETTWNGLFSIQTLQRYIEYINWGNALDL